VQKERYIYIYIYIKETKLVFLMGYQIYITYGQSKFGGLPNFEGLNLAIIFKFYNG
jgi:hypothetical protein